MISHFGKLKTSRLPLGVWLALVCLLGWLASAHAAQLTDDFANATYDGSYDTTVWGAGSSSPTLVQGSGKLAMSMPASNWAPSSIARLTQSQIGSTLPTRGTRFSATIDSFTVTTEGDQFRGGISVDHTFSLFFYDGSGYTGGMYGYNGAGFNINLYVTNAANQVAVEVTQKAAGNPGNIGKGMGYRTVTVTYPLTVDVIMNNDYYELQLNGTKVLGGVTNLEAIGIQNNIGFQVISSNANVSRGSITLDQVSISDADTVDFTAISSQITDDFSAGWNQGNLMQMEGNGGSGSFTGGQATLTTPNSDWATYGLQSTDLFPLNATNITTFPLQVDIVSVNPTSGLVNTTLCVSEYPGNYNFLLSPGYYARGDASLAAVILGDASGLNPVVSVYSKPAGTAYNNGSTLVNGQSFTLTSLPATVRLEVSQTRFNVKVNGVSVAQGTHTAAFNDRVTGYFAVANQGGGRGSITFDNMLFGANTVVPVELSTFATE
jgi:hypothetical protein